MKFGLNFGFANNATCPKPANEMLTNYTFNCGLYCWGFAPAYPATLTDNGDGTVHLKTNSNYGSLVPDSAVFPAGNYTIAIRVLNVVGKGKISIRSSNMAWHNLTEYTADGVYTETYSGDIVEIHVGAANDSSFEADYNYISLIDNSIVTYQGEVVYNNGEIVRYTPDN